MNFNMYQSVSLLLLAAVGRNEAFSLCNHSKDIELLKGQHELVIYEPKQIQDKLTGLERHIERHGVPYEYGLTLTSIKESLEKNK